MHGMVKVKRKYKPSYSSFLHAHIYCCTTFSPKAFTSISVKASLAETLPRSSWLYVTKYTEHTLLVSIVSKKIAVIYESFFM